MSTWAPDGSGIALHPIPHISNELYTPAPPTGAGTWASAGSMTTRRMGHGALALSDGTVGLMAGSGPSGVVLTSTEIYQP